MAKTTTKAAKEAEKVPIVSIDSSVSEEDVIAYDQAGVELKFEKKGFRFLSDRTLEALSHENRKRYQVVLGILKDEERARRPPPRPQVIDPLGSDEGALLNAVPANTAEGKAWGKKWHLCWKYAQQAEAMGRYGYSVVRVGEDPVECGLKPAGSTFVMADSRGRKEMDLILMKIPMHLYLEHQRAVAAKSRDAVKGRREKFAGEVEEGSKGRLAASEIEEETEKVEIGPQDLTPA
jgi:hypothetical protein